VIRFAVAAGCVGLASVAAAQPLRLRADALAQVQSPAGLLVLEAGDRSRPWLDAEALVWTGGDEDGGDGDAVIVAVEMRAKQRRAALRLGRQVVVAGALPATHLDGVAGRARLPYRFDLEAFGGIPVVPRFAMSDWDWVAGGRASRAIGAARLGLAWMQRRDRGALHTHELAGDGTLVVRGVDVAAGAAWDAIGGGLAEARLSAAKRRRSVRVELFATHRSPAHLIPATSLFSVLGDVPSRIGGTDVRWRAAPRLDVGVTAGVRIADGETDEDLTGRARLRLDEAGHGVLGIELRRQGAPDGGWTGVRGTARIPLPAHLVAMTEVELVRPDGSGDRGTLWPWALAAITRRASTWEIAGAIEASASPQYRSRVDVLVRVTRAWGRR
jgi:hypothetical protein